MPVGARVLAVRRSGWSGSVTLTQGATSVVVTPTGQMSALEIWLELLTAARAQWPSQSWTWEVSEAGYLSWTSDTLTSMTFASPLHTDLGFATTAYSTAYTRRGTGHAAGLVAPDSLVYTTDERAPGDDGDIGYGRVSWVRTPGTEHREPELRMQLTAAATVRLMDALEDLAHPGQIDVYVHPETIYSPVLTDISLQRDGRGGRHEARLRGLR
jgi:hypothetical protein